MAKKAQGITVRKERSSIMERTQNVKHMSYGCNLETYLKIFQLQFNQKHPGFQSIFINGSLI